MEVSQFTYFQQVGGIDCKPVSGELTYGLERIAMFVLGIDDVMDLPFNSPECIYPVKYSDIFQKAEREYSRWNFNVANEETLLKHFSDYEEECNRILSQPRIDPQSGHPIIMVQPAYDYCIKASHLFNLLDSRGVISPTERQNFISRVRNLAKSCAEAYIVSEKD